MMILPISRKGLRTRAARHFLVPPPVPVHVIILAAPTARTDPTNFRNTLCAAVRKVTTPAISNFKFRLVQPIRLHF